MSKAFAVISTYIDEATDQQMAAAWLEADFKQLGLSYQHVEGVHGDNTLHAFIVWNTYYVDFEALMRQLGKLCRQKTVFVGIAQEGCEANDILSAAKMHLQAISGLPDLRIVLGDSVKTVCAAAGTGFCCQLIRNTLYQAYMRKRTAADSEFPDCHLYEVRGKDVKVPGKLPFSFWPLPKGTAQDALGIQVKIKWRNPPFAPGKIVTGVMSLHGSYQYHTADYFQPSPAAPDVQQVWAFLKKYKVLFAAVWENVLHPMDLADFFRGDLSFMDLLLLLDVCDTHRTKLRRCANVRELEACVVKYRMFDMKD